VACESLLLLPLESVGEVPDDELDELDESVLVVVVVVLLDCEAYAATPTAAVPARLAATKTPVSSVVRRRPVSRFMCRPLR
jgi:hypothetical protein